MFDEKKVKGVKSACSDLKHARPYLEECWICFDPDALEVWVEDYEPNNVYKPSHAICRVQRPLSMRDIRILLRCYAETGNINHYRSYGSLAGYHGDAYHAWCDHVYFALCNVDS